MRLVIDLQGAQTGSRFRGIGRYSLSLAKGIASIRGEHEVIVAISDLFPETIDTIRAEFATLLPPESVRVWHGIGPTREVDPSNTQRRKISERLRESFLAELQPDAVLVTSLFEGLGDDGVGSLGVLSFAIPTAVILYDLIPLVSPDEHFRNSHLHKDWYERKIESLKRCDLLLAISESSRQEALNTPQFARKQVVNISGACDEMFCAMSLSPENIRDAWSRSGITRPFVMYTGGADERKNLDRLIKAYANLPDAIRSRHQLLLAGKMPDGHVESYHQTGRASGLRADELIIPGYVPDPDLISLYNTCALFVFPSLHEGFGIPPLEAMACGAPVIGANATSLPEVIGLPDALFDPTSIPEISAKIERALTDDRFRRRLLDHGREQFRKFSWTRSATIALSALEHLVGPKNARVSRLLNVERSGLFTRRVLRILAIKLDHLGDFILALPAFAKLRARYPYATIEVLLGSWNKSLAEQTKLFDAIHAYDFFRQKSSDLPKNNKDKLTEILSTLGEYDIALDLRRPADTRFVLAGVRAALKVGYGTFDDSIDSKIDILLEQHKDASFTTTPLNKTSISLQMLRVVDAIPADSNDFIKFPSIGTVQEKQQGAVAIFPKAGSSIREWTKANFQRLVELLVADPLVESVELYFSSAGDASDFASARNKKIKPVIGLPIAELTRSLSRNSVCIANNSGGAHLAAYLGLTSIAIYSGHETSAEWAPQFFDSLVLHRGAQCAPCHGATSADCPNSLFCLNDIQVEDVYAKTIEAIYANGVYSDGPKLNKIGISLQRNTDSIVNELLSSIANLPDMSASDLMGASIAISENHPEYSMHPDLRRFQLNLATDHRSTLIDWRGFSGIERDFRWSDGKQSAMLFECPSRTHSRGVLLLHVDCHGRQRIIGHLNGRKVLDSVESGRHVHLRIPVRNLEGGLNCLQFQFPDARQPGNGDSRQLAIAIREFTVQAEEASSTFIIGGQP